MGSWGHWTAGGEQLLPVLRVCGTPGSVPLQPGWLWGQDSPSRAAGMGLRPWSCRGDMTNIGEECVTPPTTPRIVPKGADRDPRQAEVSGPAKVPQCGGGEGGGSAGGWPPALSRLIANPPGRGCGTCRNSGFNYLGGAAGNQRAGRGWRVRGAGASQQGGSDSLI